MKSEGANTQPVPPVPIDLRRRDDALIQVSRLAADLFWRDGFGPTRGEDIAAAAGISSRTLWRYFRSKEACVEPVLSALADGLVRVLEKWPDDLSIRDYLATGTAQPGPIRFSVDQVRAMRVVQLGATEPALRSVWLVACDEAERRCAAVVAHRLRRKIDDPDVLRVTAAICGANRAYNDSLTADYLGRGLVPLAEDVMDVLVWTIAGASGRKLGEPIHV